MSKKMKPVPEGDELDALVTDIQPAPLEEPSDSVPQEVLDAMSRIVEQDDQPQPEPEPEPEPAEEVYGIREAYEDLKWVKLREGRAISRHAQHRLVRAMQLVRTRMEAEELL